MSPLDERPDDRLEEICQWFKGEWAYLSEEDQQRWTWLIAEVERLRTTPAVPPEPSSDAVNRASAAYVTWDDPRDSFEQHGRNAMAAALRAAYRVDAVRSPAVAGQPAELRVALEDLDSDGCVSRAIDRYMARAPGMPRPSADGIKGILEPLWAALRGQNCQPPMELPELGIATGPVSSVAPQEEGK